MNRSRLCISSSERLFPAEDDGSDERVCCCRTAITRPGLHKAAATGDPVGGQNGGKNFQNGYNPCQFLMKEVSTRGPWQMLCMWVLNGDRFS
jgi:hypothetical protein